MFLSYVGKIFSSSALISHPTRDMILIHFLERRHKTTENSANPFFFGAQNASDLANFVQKH